MNNKGQFTKGNKTWNTGKKWPEMSKMKLGSKNPMFGKKLTIEHKNKLSKIAKEKGFGKWMVGKTQSPEQIRKFKESMIKKFDSIGRKTKRERTILCGREEYKKWRSDVFARDGWTCQTCGVRGCYLEAHHIKSWAKFPQLRYEINNGVTLCKGCHKLTDSYAGKNKS